jgi:pyruvate formate lyase activating enzyme
MPLCALPDRADRGGASAFRVGGFQPFTTLDFPGRLSAVIFAQGCPLRCVYCHNRDLLPIMEDGSWAWSNICDHLQRRRDLLEAVVFSGGEPLLQAALEPAIRDVRAMGYQTALHTAGVSPQRLQRLLPELDWVGLDIKAAPDAYEDVTGVATAGDKAWDSLRILAASNSPFEVRTTVWPELMGVQDVRDLSARLVTEGVRHFALQEARDPVSSKAMGGDVVLDEALHRELAGLFETFDLRRAA